MDKMFSNRKPPGRGVVPYVTALLLIARPGYCVESPACPLTSPSVEKGLSIEPRGRKIIIHPGACYVNDRRIVVPQPVTMDIPPAPVNTVKGEPVKMTGDRLLAQSSETILLQCRAFRTDPAPLKDVLAKGSLVLRSGTGADSSIYKKGEDYLIDEAWGALAIAPKSTIKRGQTVFADYRHWTRRIDTLVMDGEGNLRLLRGQLARSAPEPPAIANGVLPLANIYVRPGTDPVSTQDILPIAATGGATVPGPVRATNSKALARTLSRLRSGEPVKIAFWGDSITGGADASATDRWFTSVFMAEIARKFPQARVVPVNLGIGGSNTSGRLPRFADEVLAHSPDLVVLEFVNDMSLKPEAWEASYPKIIAACRARNAELLFITPHLPAPYIMGVKTWAQVAQKPYIKFLRDKAREEKVALADVAARWEHLEREGLRPDLILVDELIHPNDRGHAIFAQELSKCFD